MTTQREDLARIIKELLDANIYIYNSDSKKEIGLDPGDEYIEEICIILEKLKSYVEKVPDRWLICLILDLGMSVVHFIEEYSTNRQRKHNISIERL